MKVRIDYKKQEGGRLILCNVEDVIIHEKIRCVEIVRDEGKTLINIDTIRDISIDTEEEDEI